MTCRGPENASLTVLLIDDIQTQAARIQECLRPYGICVEWCPSYRLANARLTQPDEGQLFDLILIDQAFDVGRVPSEDLLTRHGLEVPPGAENWDVQLHQGLYILAQLARDMHEGRIPVTPMMILTHYGRIEIAAQALWLGGYESKRRLIGDPYTALKGQLGQMQPTEADVDRRLGKVAAELRIDAELAAQVRRKVLDGIDPDEACAALQALSNPNDWRVVGRALDRLAEDQRPFTVDRIANRVAGAWLASPDGWLRIHHVEALGPLEPGFDVLQLQIAQGDTTFPALLAATAMRQHEIPSASVLRPSFALVRRIDERSRPLRLRAGSWTIVGCWLPEPKQDPGGPGAGAALRRLIGTTRHLRALHGRHLAHGSLAVLSARFDAPLFGGVRCLTGQQDFAELRRDDLRRLPLLAEATFGEEGPPGVREALRDWAAAVGRGDLELAERILAGVHLETEPPAYYDFDRLYSGGEVGFRDRLLASLGPDDAVLREVSCPDVTSVPMDFVVCVGGVVAVLEHRSRIQRVVLADGDIAVVESAPPQPEVDRFRRSLARGQRCAEALAARIERAMALAPGSIGRLAAIVVDDESTVEAHGRTGCRPVVTAGDAIAVLTRLSREGGRPTGVAMATCLPKPDRRPATSEDRYRALYWKTSPLDADAVRMWTWRKQWPAGWWQPLLRDLAGAAGALLASGAGWRAFPLMALRAYDDDGAPRIVEAEEESVDRFEYEMGIPATATPLSTYFAERGSEVGRRRRLAADVLRNLQCWERSSLAYRSMDPDGVVYAGDRVYCDLLHAVVPSERDPESRRCQRRGAAACLVFLLSPWPYAWPGVLTGTLPALQDRPDEDSAWGIAAKAVAALLNPDMAPETLAAALDERARLLDAAAELAGRFPAWRAGPAEEARP